jgi:magnesium-transporting ATPase (P-type)
MIVDAVGNKTFIGEISNEIQTDTRESPLKLRLSKLARQISVLGYMAAISVALIYIFNAVILDSAFNQSIILLKLRDWRFILKTLLNAFTFGLTVLVTTVPEGLPLMVSVVLSSNIKSMIKDNVLVKKPVGIEAAGSMNILFTDKTGTLTEGRLSVGEIYLGDGSGFSTLRQLKACERVYESYILGAHANSSSVSGKNKQGERDALGGNSTDSVIAGINSGNLYRVFEKADAAGTKYMLVEQDDCYGEDPFACLKRSYDFLKARGFA